MKKIYDVIVDIDRMDYDFAEHAFFEDEDEARYELMLWLTGDYKAHIDVYEMDDSIDVEEDDVYEIICEKEIAPVDFILPGYYVDVQNKAGEWETIEVTADMFDDIIDDPKEVRAVFENHKYTMPGSTVCITCLC